MQGKLIYEKEYPPIERIYQPEYEDAAVSEIPPNDLYSGRRLSTYYTVIPERDARGEEFIREAIRVSELYGMSARIVRHEEKITVQLSFDFGTVMRQIYRLFGMADSISFTKDKNKRDVTVNLDYYTHVVVKNGISIAP